MLGSGQSDFFTSLVKWLYQLFVNEIEWNKFHFVANLIALKMNIFSWRWKSHCMFFFWHSLYYKSVKLLSFPLVWSSLTFGFLVVQPVPLRRAPIKAFEIKREHQKLQSMKHWSIKVCNQIVLLTFISRGIFLLCYQKQTILPAGQNCWFSRGWHVSNFYEFVWFIFIQIRMIIIL